MSSLNPFEPRSEYIPDGITNPHTPLDHNNSYDFSTKSLYHIFGFMPIKMEYLCYDRHT